VVLADSGCDVCEVVWGLVAGLTGVGPCACGCVRVRVGVRVLVWPVCVSLLRDVCREGGGCLRMGDGGRGGTVTCLVRGTAHASLHALVSIVCQHRVSASCVSIVGPSQALSRPACVCASRGRARCPPQPSGFVQAVVAAATAQGAAGVNLDFEPCQGYGTCTAQDGKAYGTLAGARPAVHLALAALRCDWLVAVTGLSL
jgi:hypothetical protein